MVFNKKEFSELNRTVLELREKIESQHFEVLQAQSKNIDLVLQLIDRIKSLEEKHDSLSKCFAEEIKKTENLNRKFEGRINSFKTLENAAKKKLLEETSFEIKNQLRSLFMTTQNYQKLEGDVVSLQNRINDTSEEIMKFNKISKDIKSADFQLSNFVKQITRQDKEKLSLMRENEKLKLLISKERRKNRIVF